MKVAAILALLLLAFVAMFALAGYRFEHETRERVAALGTGAPPPPATLAAAELEGLPLPVQQYLRTVLADYIDTNRPLPQRARIAHAGSFLMQPPDGWSDFASVEHFAATPPGFVWDARIMMSAAMPVRVRDAFVGGKGYMSAAVWGVIPVMDVRGTPDIAQGALTRYLAEAPWFPVALLPSRGVRWSPLGERSARATLTAGGTTATVDFFFGEDGMPVRMFCAARMRDVDGRGEPTPWEGRLRDYALHGGLRVPTAGEVAWLLPEGRQVYWKGSVTDARYE